MTSPWPLCRCYVVEQGGQHLPLIDLDVHVSVLCSSTRTTIKQRFDNPPGRGALGKVRYDFPLYDGVSVVGFTCTVGQAVIKGVVQERLAANKTFDDAISRGETAGLLDQDFRASDVFTASLGCVQAGERVEIEITCLGQVEHDAQEDTLRLTIPTTIAPRYGQDELVYAAAGSSTAHGGKMSMTVDIEMAEACPISNVLSPSHPISVSMGKTSTMIEPPSPHRASATMTLETAELQKDFVLLVAAGLTSPAALLETHPTFPNQRALMATLVPRFNLPVQKPEVVFVCDRSGSMGYGASIPNLIAALQILLVSLPVGARFNICSFGSHYSFLWEKSQAYDQERVDEAAKHVKGFQSDYGGTEMLEPLEETFKRRCADMNLDVFLLTDGEIWHQNELFRVVNEYVAESAGAIRVFTLGIGDHVSSALIQGVARAGNGFAQTVSEGEKMEKKIIRMLKGALTPHVKDYALEVKYGEEDDYELVERVVDQLSIRSDMDDMEPKQPKEPISLFNPDIGDDEMEATGASHAEDDLSSLPELDTPRYLQTPSKIPALFPFNRTTVYVMLSDSTPSREPTSVILTGTWTQRPLRLEIPVTKLRERGTMIHQLAARKAIEELEEKGGWVGQATDSQGKGLRKELESKGQLSRVIRREAARLGVRYQVAGKWCSFVAVNNDDGDGNQDKEDKEMLGTFEVVHREEGSVMGMAATTCFMAAAPVGTGPSLFGGMTGGGGNSPGIQRVCLRGGGSYANCSDCSDEDGVEIQCLDDGDCEGAPNSGSIQNRGGTDDNNVVSELALLQTFVGSWPWSKPLEKMLGLAKEETMRLKNVKADDDDDDGQVLATLCVILFLKQTLAGDKEVWELMVEKAQEWLEKQTGEKAADLEDWFLEARL